ncbi:hypothetical protein P245_20795 [Comamonas thiooxydans]|uniref:Lipoprotein n=1 Tax=Comamonas thiooxydans TaxID=363952 RepID=A0A0E3BAP0_9BURK|nr:hypothetical protein [Comamonas thiooxydans]KGG86158.1 hypothetical protein P245_20795 [Comamonas thiooxydans]
MKWTIYTAFIAFTAMLAGCDGAVEKVGAVLSDEPMTYVFAPGYEIAVDGKSAPVYGRDECPKEEPAMNVIFGRYSHEGSSDCLVIGPTSKTVLARVVIDGNLRDELWTVEHYERNPFKVALHRPDGSPVISFK